MFLHSITFIILMGKRELVALLNMSSWCLEVVERLFFAVPWGCLRFVRFVVVVFPDHTHLLLLIIFDRSMYMNALPCFQFELFPFNELEW